MVISILCRDIFYYTYLVVCQRNYERIFKSWVLGASAVVEYLTYWYVIHSFSDLLFSLVVRQMKASIQDNRSLFIYSDNKEDSNTMKKYFEYITSVSEGKNKVTYRTIMEVNDTNNPNEMKIYIIERHPAIFLSLAYQGWRLRSPPLAVWGSSLHAGEIASPKIRENHAVLPRLSPWWG